MKEEKSIIEKIQKTCGIGCIITNIFKIFGIVMSVVVILMGGVFVGVNARINQVLKEAVGGGISHVGRYGISGGDNAEKLVGTG